MLSALKKLVGSESVQLRDRHIPAGLQSMNQSLQRRFAKGVQYNSEQFLQPLTLTCELFRGGQTEAWGPCVARRAIESGPPSQSFQR